jgi:hypothetical protein
MANAEAFWTSRASYEPVGRRLARSARSGRINRHQPSGSNKCGSLIARTLHSNRYGFSGRVLGDKQVDATVGVFEGGRSRHATRQPVAHREAQPMVFRE